MTNRWSRRLALLAPLSLAACATFGGREPVIVDVVGVEPLAGQGNRFASGVSDVRGTVPRFGETVLSVPVTVPVSAMVAQALSLASGDRARLDYELRGRLADAALGGVSFRSTGELALPTG